MPTDNWNLAPPPGFRGLHPDVPLSIYDRHLPHWRQDGATYFVTFRLADSLPQSKLRELDALRREFFGKLNQGREGNLVTDGVLFNARLAHETWQALSEARLQRIEKWLDQGMGNCELQRPDVSEIVVEALHYFDDQFYELGCYVVMPNHVHLILRPLDPLGMPLEKILQSRKRRTSRAINRLLQRSGKFWQEESFDRIIRDEEHLYAGIQYIGQNPRLAGLPADRWCRWVRPSWERLGWSFEDPSRQMGGCHRIDCQSVLQ